MVLPECRQHSSLHLQLNKSCWQSFLANLESERRRNVDKIQLALAQSTQKQSKANLQGDKRDMG